MKLKAITTFAIFGFTLPLLSLNNVQAIQTLKKPTQSTISINNISNNTSTNNSLLVTQESQSKWIYVGAANNAIDNYRRKHDIPGMSVAIAKNGQVIYANGFGWENIKKNIKASKLTRYRLGSVSKPVTAILAMEMHEKGKLLLNQNIRDYLPELPSHHNYQIGYLLSHKSGVRHYNEDNESKDPTENVNTYYVRTKDALNLFIKDKLVAIPKSKYSYSTHAYTVLAAAMENISGKTFFQYASERFRNWELKDLSPELAQLNQRNRSEIYKRDDGKNKVSNRDNLSWKYAGGGYQSSVLDLAKLGIKLLDAKIINKQSLDLMWTEQKTIGGETTDYGLGWIVSKDENGRKIVGHDGEQNGAASYWRIYPNDKVVVVVLSNIRDHDPEDLAVYLGRVAITGSTAKSIR